tara:strand:+ start:1094 stop:1525 length:432 start_codon:yes stop_codon:yes gene_type:complete
MMDDKLGSFGGFIICTNNLKGSIDWWTKVIGLVKGYTPPTELHSQWLYIDKIPLLQVYPVPSKDEPWNTVIGGINLNCVNLSHWVSKLSKYGVEYKYSTQALGGFGIQRLQILDPNMLTINLIFVGYDNDKIKDPRLELEDNG